MPKDDYFFIKSLKTKNFKSFFGSISFGPFHPKINVIIGPNGSGKSNFLEALMFTFGKRATNLRSKKLGNLIYNSKFKSGLFSSSTVFLSFNEQSILAPLRELREISISRKIFRKWKSKFYLNGKSTKFFFLKKIIFFFNVPLGKDLIEIKQGEINNILKMNSMGEYKKRIGIIEYVDENIGSTCYLFFILNKLKNVNSFFRKKIFFFNDEIKRLIKERILTTQKKTLNYIYFLISDSLKKIFLWNISIKTTFNRFFLRGLKTKQLTLYSKFVIFLSQKIKIFISLNLSFIRYELKILKKYGLVYSESKNKPNLIDFWLKVNDHQKIFKKKKKFGFNFLKVFQNYIISFQKKIFLFFRDNFLKFRFKIFLKSIIYKKILIFTIIPNTLKVTRFSRKISKQNFLFFDNILKFNYNKILLITNENFSKVKCLRFNNKKKISEFFKYFQALQFSKKSFLSAASNSQKSRSNYSICKSKNKFDSFRKIVQNLTKKENRKFFLTKEKFSKLKIPGFFLGFSIGSELILTGKIFPFETKTLISKYQGTIFSIIVYLRNNFFSRIKLQQEKEKFESDWRKIKTFCRYQKFLNKRFFILEKCSRVVGYNFKKTKKMGNLKKICKMKTSRIRLKDVEKTFKINIDPSKKINSKKNLKSNLIFYSNKKLFNFYWILNFSFFFGLDLAGKKIYDENKRYSIEKNKLGQKIFILQTKTEIYKYVINKLKKKKNYKRNLYINGHFFFKLYKETPYISFSNIHLSNFSKNLKWKILVLEKVKSFYLTKLWIFYFSMIKNSLSGNLIPNIIERYEKYHCYDCKVFLNSIKNGNCKLLILEKTDIFKKFRTGKILCQIYNRKLKNLNNFSIFLSESILLKNSSNLFLKKLILKITLRKKRILIIIKKRTSKIKCLYNIFKNRLKLLKCQIIIKSFLKERLISDRKGINFKKKNYYFHQQNLIFFHRLMFDLKQNKNNAHYKMFFVNYFSSKNHLNTFFSKKILSCFLKKKYSDKQKGLFKIKFLNNHINLLIFKSLHLIKILDFHIGLELLNKTLRQKFLFFFQNGSMKIDSINKKDFFSDGLHLLVDHKRIKSKNFFQMSGGEKTLSSLCLLLSFQDLFSFKWYLLDEIDAALDFKNVTKLSFQFKYQIKNSQIFLITLRNNLILNINYIFGIYKFKKASNTICLRI